VPGGPPAGRWDVLRGQRARYDGGGLAGVPVTDDPLDNLVGEDPGAAEDDAAGLGGGEGVAGAGGDQLALVLADGGNKVREEFPGGGGGVDAEVEGGEGPALPGREPEQGREVDDGPG
jgi:hypothetical protein